MKFTITKLNSVVLVLSSAFLLSNISVQGQFAPFPPANVTSVMDRDQMVWQLGIKFPQLPPKLQDPIAPPNTYPTNAASPEDNWRDAYGHTITRSGFGLWNNYDDRPEGILPAGADGNTLGGPEAWRVGSYTPLDLLKMNNGTPVTSVAQWYSQRRPEIFKDVQEEFWGVLPDASVLPGVTFSTAISTGVTTPSAGSPGGFAYRQKVITGNIDVSAYPQVRNVPRITATLRTPLDAKGPVPVIVVFSGVANTYYNYVAPKGWGICIFNQNALQPDNGVGLTSYLIGLVNKGNWRKPNDWGALVAWGWGVSKLIDYFQTDTDVDAKKIGVTGHSRYGKATIVAMAYDSRIAISYPSCSGSLGLKMNKRHWGQDVENSGWDQEYHWMAGNFFKYQGPLNQGSYLPRKIELCPVDAQSLLALCAPRPVFSNGGTGDSWSDPYGTYLSEVAANPVYNMLGYKGIIMTDQKPQVDAAYIEGQLGFRYHNGGHTDAPDWPAFIEFAQRYLNNNTPGINASQHLNINEGARENAIVGKLQATDADANTTFKNWQITGGSGASLFDINGVTGELMLKKSLSLDFENKTSYTLLVTVSDGITTSETTELTVNVMNENDNAPDVNMAQIFNANKYMLSNTIIGTVSAKDNDDSNQPGFTKFQDWVITGGTGASIFAIGASTGKITLKNGLALILQNKSTYNLSVKVSDGKYISTAKEVIINMANKISICHSGRTLSVSLSDAILHLLHGDYVGECNNYSTVSNSMNENQASMETMIENNSISIFPNPVNDRVNISLGNNNMHIKKIELLDISGRLLMQVPVKGKTGIESIAIPRGKLVPGIYLLRMQGDKLMTHKIIIK